MLATEYLSMRDALILAALREMGGGELHMLYARPHSMESAAVVTCELSRAFEDAEYRPDMRRWGRATALLESVTADAPDGYEAQPMAACAYLMWMADRSTVAAVRAQGLGLGRGLFAGDPRARGRRARHPPRMDGTPTLNVGRPRGFNPTGANGRRDAGAHCG